MSWLEYNDKKADEAGGGDFTPIPVDTEIPVRISDAELRSTSTGGKMVRLSLTVIDGKYKKRKIWHNLHVENKNESTMHRDRRTLADIAKIVHADISGGPSDLAKLKGKDLLCTVTEHEDSDYNGKKSVFERVGKFRTDPSADNTSGSDFDDDDIPF